jgi:hypothetical protein
MIKLQNWYMTSLGISPYRPPELQKLCVGGQLESDHPNGRFMAGSDIHTSPVIDFKGRTFTTRGGTQYKLGKIHKEYRDWLTENGYVYNHTNPFLSKKREENV